MIARAAQKHALDLSTSVLVGDSLTDIQAGAAGGVGKLFFFSQDGTSVCEYIRGYPNLFGLARTAPNFNYPYFSRSIRESGIVGI